MSGPSGGTARQSTFPLPASLTVAGRHAFDGAVQAYATQLTEQLSRQTHGQYRRPDSVHTTQDVQEARLAYEQRLREESMEHAAGVRGAAVLLLIIAAGFGVLSTYATGIAQSALLGLFVAAESAGLMLVWRSRPRPPDGR